MRPRLFDCSREPNQLDKLYTRLENGEQSTTGSHHIFEFSDYYMRYNTCRKHRNEAAKPQGLMKQMKSIAECDVSCMPASYRRVGSENDLRTAYDEYRTSPDSLTKEENLVYIAKIQQKALKAMLSEAEASQCKKNNIALVWAMSRDITNPTKLKLLEYQINNRISRFKTDDYRCREIEFIDSAVHSIQESIIRSEYGRYYNLDSWKNDFNLINSREFIEFNNKFDDFDQRINRIMTFYNIHAAAWEIVSSNIGQDNAKYAILDYIRYASREDHPDTLNKLENKVINICADFRSFIEERLAINPLCQSYEEMTRQNKLNHRYGNWS